MNAFYFIITSLAVWRLSYLFSNEDGPFNIIYLLRQKAAAGFFGNLLSCFYCTSIWVALPFGIWLGNTLILKFIMWLALSGAACLLQKATSKETSNSIPYYEEDSDINQQDITPIQ
jgi:hypothetical protein